MTENEQATARDAERETLYPAVVPYTAPCPFCGSSDTNPAAVLSLTRYGKGHAAGCMTCDKSGPACPTVEEAAHAWNSLPRVQPAFGDAPRCPRCGRANVAQDGEVCPICAPTGDDERRAVWSQGVTFTLAPDGCVELSASCSWLRPEQVRAAASLLTRTGPDAPPEGSTCHGCGNCFTLDVMVPDLVWEAIYPGADGAGLLCPTCIAQRCAEQLGAEYLVALPVLDDCPGMALPSSDASCLLRDVLTGSLEAVPDWRDAAEDFPLVHGPVADRLRTRLFDVIYRTTGDVPQRLAPILEGVLQVLEDDAASSRDWPEDFAHEDGRSLCACIYCTHPFVGRKGRVVCRVCADRPAVAAAQEPSNV